MKKYTITISLLSTILTMHTHQAPAQSPNHVVKILEEESLHTDIRKKSVNKSSPKKSIIPAQHTCQLALPAQSWLDKQRHTYYTTKLHKLGISLPLAHEISRALIYIHHYPTHLNQAQHALHQALFEEINQLKKEGKSQQAQTLLKATYDHTTQLNQELTKLVQQAHSQARLSWLDYINPLQLPTTSANLAQIIKMWIHNLTHKQANTKSTH